MSLQFLQVLSGTGATRGGRPGRCPKEPLPGAPGPSQPPSALWSWALGSWGSALGALPAHPLASRPAHLPAPGGYEKDIWGEKCECSETSRNCLSQTVASLAEHLPAGFTRALYWLVRMRTLGSGFWGPGALQLWGPGSWDPVRGPGPCSPQSSGDVGSWALRPGSWVLGSWEVKGRRKGNKVTRCSPAATYDIGLMVIHINSANGSPRWKKSTQLR